jgi:cyclase
LIATRVIPVLLLKGAGLVKTVRFKDPKYVGDPRNAVKIFNEKEVDELVILDIKATTEARRPQFELIREIVSEAFMPVAYGGGIRTLEDAGTILSLGVEKIVLNSYAVENPSFVREASASLGAQSVVVCLDVRKSLLGKYEVYGHGGSRRGKVHPVTFARTMEEMGAGELIVNSIDRDGTMAGYDLELVKGVAGAVSVPVIACGGAGIVEDFEKAVTLAGASAVAAGSMFVFHGRHRAVLISYPEPAELKRVFSRP